MIGGLITITNGAFPVECGDSVQWYWQAEERCFDEEGKRLTDSINIDALNSDKTSEYLSMNAAIPLQRDGAKRRRVFEQGNGVWPNMVTSNNTVFNGKQEVAFIKALKPDSNYEFRISDKERIFAKAMGSARPFEACDILIMRQSM
jgi:hypothetical protein